MHISFFPQLNSWTRVPAGFPSNELNGSQAPTHITFTANLSEWDYEELIREGARIEIWTNAPARGNNEGEWTAVAFQEVQNSEPVHKLDSVKHNGVELRLAASDAHVQSAPNSKDKAFSAAISLPSTPGKLYEFTYRVIYPSGIHWLGTENTNGRLDLVAGDGFFAEEGKWENQGKARLFVNTEHKTGDTIVGKIDMKTWSWGGWATDGSTAWPVDLSSNPTVTRARLFYLLPREKENTALSPQPVVFRATSWSSPISITPQGEVIIPISGIGSIERRLHFVESDDDLASLHSEVITSSPAPEILMKSKDFILFSPNNESDVSATIFFFSLTYATPRKITIPISAFDSFLPNYSYVTLFSQETNSVYFIDRHEQPGSISNVVLTTGNTGSGQFIISAAYEFTDKPGKLRFSLPFFTARPEIWTYDHDVENPLPTPPASPHITSKHAVSFAAIEEMIVSPEGVPNYPEDTSSESSEDNSVTLLSTVDDDEASSDEHDPSVHGQLTVDDRGISNHLFASVSTIFLLFSLFARQLFSYLFQANWEDGNQVNAEVEDENTAETSVEASTVPERDSDESDYNHEHEKASDEALPVQSSEDREVLNENPDHEYLIPPRQPYTDVFSDPELRVVPSHAPTSTFKWNLSGNGEQTIIIMHSDEGIVVPDTLQIEVSGKRVQPRVQVLGDDTALLDVMPTLRLEAPSSLVVKLGV